MKYTAIACLFLWACSSTTPEDKQLVWMDEFDTPGKPDPGKWSYDLGDGCPDNCGWGNNELQFYTNDPANVRIADGKLVVEAHMDSLGGKSFTSTKIVSRGHRDWKYARLEIRAKLPRGKGTWPAVWMLPTDWKYGGWPASGEIDIMEHVGYDPGVVHGTIHTESYNHIKGTQKEGKITMADAQDAFHVYAVDWSEDKMDFFVDDHLYHSVTRDPKDGYEEWPFDQRFYLIMNIAVGGNWGGAEGVDPTIWPQRMEIDYVRVYQ
ncbi:MAG: glycoside hydrolase family 16 protein [Bacteroidota bacterium]|nr:glycoside hydrolase family 16 protein [Bacteroidota bacterium]